MVELVKAIARIFFYAMSNRKSPLNDCSSKRSSSTSSKETEEKLDASLMYGALFTWFVLQMVVLPVVSGRGPISCMSRTCHPVVHTGKLEGGSLAP